MKLLKTILFIVLTSVMIYSCGGPEEKNEENLMKGVKKIKVDLVEEASYTYVRAMDGNREIWIATDETGIQVGETYYFLESLRMPNFESKDTKMFFDTLYFAEIFTSEPITEAWYLAKNSPHKEKPEITQEEVYVEPVEGSITISDLYAGKADYENKVVTVRGVVVKFNPAILDRNWVHLQDGTGEKGQHDLTITTNATVNLGDTVIFTGKITLDKDFGAGYTYELIMEEGEVDVEM